MMNLDWIVKNWDFLSARRIKEISASRFERIFREEGLPSTGKFYGTEEFFTQNRSYGCLGFNGSKRLALRPYITAPMPTSRIKAIYIDPKRYTLDAEGEITGMDCYELPIVIFVE